MTPLSPISGFNSSSYQSSPVVGKKLFGDDVSCSNSSSGLAEDLNALDLRSNLVKKRPLDHSSSSSSFQFTSPSTSRETPEDVRKIKRIASSNGLTKVLTPDSEKLVQNVDSIFAGKSPSIPEGVYQSLRSRCLTEKTKKTDSPFTQNIRAQNTVMSSPWVGPMTRGLAKVLGQISPGIVNMEHITQQGRKGGFHYCPEGDPKWADMEDVMQSPNGVVSAKWTERKGGSKHSTFFPPDWPNEKAVFEKIHHSIRDLYYSNDGRVVLRKHEASGVYMEGFMNPAKPIEYQSVYPCFMFVTEEELMSQDPIVLTKECTLGGKTSFPISRPRDEILQIAHNSRVSYTHKSGKTVLVDVAPGLGIGVPRGILVEIPKVVPASAGICSGAATE